MKNILTTLTLLAAGTSLASADVVVWDKTPSEVSGSSVATWNVSSSGLTWSSEVGESVIFTIDATSISSELSYTLFSVNDKSYKNLSSVSISAGNIVFKNFNNSDVTISLADVSAESNLTFVFNRTDGNAATLDVYVDGDFSSAAKTVTGASSGFYFGTSNTWTTLAFGGIGSESPTVTPAVSNDDAESFTLLAAGYTVGAIATQDDLIQYSTSAIPEPSAFGLIAGMGALALVAARRRRSR